MHLYRHNSHGLLEKFTKSLSCTNIGCPLANHAQTYFWKSDDQLIVSRTEKMFVIAEFAK